MLQCYDNAAVMSGHLSGKIQKQFFVNFDNHSLKLCGVHAASCALETATYFLYSGTHLEFFSKSTYRCQQLQKEVGCCVKRECATRWSARADAVNVVAKNYEKIVDVLEVFNEPEAHVVLNSVTAYNFIHRLHFWDGLLNHINRVKLRLQDPKMNFHEVVKKNQRARRMSPDNAQRPDI